MRDHSRLFPVLIACIVAGSLFLCSRAEAVFFEKKFVVKKDMGKDVLCDAYVVRKDDYVTLLLKQRGDIAYRDFPKFLEIFKRLNPEVHDVNIIYPNQHLIIPLKILAPGSVEGQASGTVTIPVITITNRKESLRQNSALYEIKYGDWVSKLISQRFGPYNSKAYREGMKLFAEMNPDISDINVVRAGQKVHLPDPAILKQDWYSGQTTVAVKAQAKPEATEPEPKPKPEPKPEKPKPVPIVQPARPVAPVQTVEKTPPPKPVAPIPIPLSAPASKMEIAELPPVEPVAPEPEKKAPALPEIKLPPKAAPVAPVKQAPGFTDKSVFEKAARIMGANFLTSGEYFFPRSSASDFRLDLSVIPVMEFDSGDRILFAEKGWLTLDETNVITAYWKKARILVVRPDLSLEETLNNVITAIATGGYETRQSFTDGLVSVDMRANYIFTPPGGGATTCLSLLDRSEMQMNAAFHQYLVNKGVNVSEWIESPSFSEWAPATGENSGAYPGIDTVAATDRLTFVRTVCTAMGWRYQEKVEVSFPYAGFQIKAVMDMISFSPGNDLLVDYGDLGGDAVVAIRNTGFKIVQLPAGTDAGTFINTLSVSNLVTIVKDPNFWVTDRPKLYNPSFQVSGNLISGKDAGSQKILWVSTPIPDELVLFLNHRGIRLLVSQ